MKLFLKSRNYYFKEILAFLFLLLAVYFFSRQRLEIITSVKTVESAQMNYVWLGLLITVVYILLQGLMYVYCFRAVGNNISLGSAVRLFLKRNLVSVFLPGGGVTSLAFFTKDIEKQNVTKAKINFASYFYGIIGILSLVLVAVPVLLYEGLAHTLSGNIWLSFIVLTVFVVALIGLSYSFLKQGRVYKKVVKFFPQAQAVSEEITSGNFSMRHLMLALACSTVIEFTGMLHMYIAMLALHLPANIEVCISGYIIATIFLAVSPFLRGLGAVEISLTYILMAHGFDRVQGLSVTILYRVFEFWAPLVIGALSFLFNKENLILRIFPAVLIFLLGCINIVSVLTPPIADRVKLLLQFLPQSAIHASNVFVLLLGVVLIVCSAFLLKGLRNAWILALMVSIFSLIGHITKAIDYEEASLALFAVITLLITRKQYYLKGNKSLQEFNWLTALAIFGAVIIYGIVGFYFLDKRHFGIDFSWHQSISATLRNLIFIDSGLHPLTRFAKSFETSLNILGVASVVLLLYSFIKPYVYEHETERHDLEKAHSLIEKYGRSAMDYFKTYADKNLFFSENFDAFVAYKFTAGYAVALEEPVCEDKPDIISAVVNEFDAFCFNNNLKTAYYRIDEQRLDLFTQLDKKSVIIGQEAIVDTEQFSLEGRDRKSLRNGLNSLNKKGFKIITYNPPLSDGLLQKLKFVSDDWLNVTDRDEMVFAEGMFNWDEIKAQTVITLESSDEKVMAFLNLVPDYKKDEATYDLIRKTADAPGANMDALIIELIKYCQTNKIKYLNLGLAPMSGIEEAKNLPERTIKFAFEKLKQFKHYQGLRDFKDKFDPVWQTKYLVYENSYDLIQLPIALNKVMKA